ncbi:DUF3850 domain-containing protein [Klebsiella sp. JB_Kp018]|uniref:DUF3850 domain-containing protein n=1 Tax=Klebsiella sp. JB_Kp018 TaxID=3153370 RepID=UPI0032B4BEFA
MTVKIHELKITSRYFNEVFHGNKKAELRKDDRGYKVGDVISLCEWEQQTYTGRKFAVVITHILAVNDVLPMPGNWIPGHWVMLSIRPLTTLDVLEVSLRGGAV